MTFFRQVHVKIWKDGWFLSLPPDYKLLFLYLFTNERAALAGIYELPLKVICFETDLDQETVLAGFAELEKADKAMYADGVVWVKNLRKYHETKSPKVQTRIQKDLMAVPDGEVLEAYCQVYGIDRVSIGLYMYMSKSKSDLVPSRSLDSADKRAEVERQETQRQQVARKLKEDADDNGN